MTWNWQQPNWPNFRYDEKMLRDLENQFLKQSGILIGTLNHLTNKEKNNFTIDLMGDEAYKTSEIEGEMLNRDSLRSSIARHFGLITTSGKIPPAELGIADMMIHLLQNALKPLSNKTLFQWHLMLMPGQWRIRVGAYRRHKEAMQVVSEHSGKLKIHFEAPPSEQVPEEMRRFITWFRKTAPSGKAPLPALTRAAIAHLYFVSIHPFEDGNGRIGRAIAQKSLMQNLDHPAFIALSHIIQKNKKNYYTQLQNTNRSLDISNWIVYFAKTILEAQAYTQRLVLFLVEKTHFYDRLRDQLNSRQQKVLARIFKEGLDGFTGGLSAENYVRIAKTSASTATRDLADLVQKNALFCTGELKNTRYFLNIKVRP